MQDKCEVFRVPEVRRNGEHQVLGGGRNFGFNLCVAPRTESLGVPNFGKVRGGGDSGDAEVRMATCGQNLINKGDCGLVGS